MLSWGFATKGVCVRAGVSCCDSRQRKRLKRAEKNKSLQKGAVMQARAPNWDLAAVESEGKASMLLSLFKQRRGGAPPCVARSWGQGGAAVSLSGLYVHG